jgi:iron-sulfur cluster repair protein YtfE (RIC family)
MLVTLGTRSAPADLVDLLLECHHRIRRFLALAGALTAGWQDDEIRVTAAQVRRYFAEALPLHVQDEDETIAPALAAASPAVLEALSQMSREHVEMEPAIERLIDACAQLAADPRRQAALASTLAATVAELTRRFASHLSLEEQMVFPSVLALPHAVREELRAAIHQRRVGHAG